MLNTLLLSLTLLGWGEGPTSVVSLRQHDECIEITIQSKEAAFAASDIKVRVEGMVSNSRLEGHEFAKFSLLQNSSSCELVKSEDPRKSCKETIETRHFNDQITILIKHEHSIPDRRPLLGKRKITLVGDNFKWVGEVQPKENTNLNIEDIHYGRRAFDSDDINTLCKFLLRDGEPYGLLSYMITPPRKWTRDSCIFFNAFSEPLSGMYSSHYLDSKEIVVRPGQKLRLKFQYKVLKDTDGEFKCQFTQYSEMPGYWRNVISEVTVLKATNEWIKFEKVVRLSPDTNKVVFRAQFYNAEWGNAWIRDLTLTPVDGKIEIKP